MAINVSEFQNTKHTGLKIHNDRITFLFDIRVLGKRHRRKWKANKLHSKSDRLKTAYNKLESFRDEIEHKNTITANVDATVNEYWEKLKIVKGWKPELIKNYNYYYDKHLSVLSNIKIVKIKPSHFTDLNVSLNSYALATQKKAYEILKPLFDLAVEDEIIIKTPIKKSHIPVRKQLEEKKIVTDASLKYRKIHSAIHQLYGIDEVVKVGDVNIKCTVNPHHRALFLFGFYGRRLKEVTSLQWKDINFKNNSYIIRGSNSKVNTDMNFALPSDVREALLEFVTDSENVFHIKHVKDHYPKIRLLSGIDDFSFHWMRNLSVSALSAMGASLGDLTALLGHNDSSTLKKYLSLQRESATKNTNELSNKLLRG